MGFAVPLGRWLHGPLREWMEACTSPARLREEDLLRPDAVARLRARAAAGDGWHAYKLWAICVFQDWLGASRSDRGVRHAT